MLLAIYLFLLIYAPKIGAWGEIISLVSMFLVIRTALIGPIEPPIVRRLRASVMALLIALFAYSLFAILINYRLDPYYVLRFGRILVQFLGGYALLRLYYLRYYENMAEKILLHLYWAIAAHATIMVLMYFFPSIRYFILNALRITYESRGGPAAFSGKRVGGLSVALDTLSAVQGFGIVLFPLIVKQLRGLKLIVGSVTLVIIGFSVLISGRTGTVLLAILLPVAMFYMWRRVFAIFLRVGMAVAVLVVAMLIIHPGGELEFRLQGEWERLISLLTPYEAGGAGVEEGAVAKLIDDYTNDWPQDATVFLFGNATSSRPVESPNFIPADPGYILDVYGLGIAGSFLMLLFYVICLWQAKKCFAYHKLLALAALLYALDVLIVNGKVRFVLAREGFTISVVLLVACAYLRSFQFESYDGNQLDEPAG